MPFTDRMIAEWRSDRHELTKRLIIRELMSRDRAPGPFSEQKLTDMINQRYGTKSKVGAVLAFEVIKKTGLREAAIGIEGEGLIRRTGDGIERIKLTSAEIYEYFALRLEDEYESLCRLLEMKDERPKMGSRNELRVIVDEQEELNAVTTKVSRGREASDHEKAEEERRAMRWVELGWDFHFKIAESAGLPVRAARLRNCIMRLRLGSDAKLPDLEERAEETRKHRALVDELDPRKELPSIKSKEDWILDHIRESAKSFLGAREHRKYDADSFRDIWDTLMTFLPEGLYRQFARK
jgi:DNA-binding GntR family transcriptional regulator